MEFLFIALIIVGGVWAVRAVIRAMREEEILSEQHLHSLQVLEDRYARGEISRHEYLRKKRDITR